MAERPSCLLVAQRLHGVEAGGAPSGVESEQHADTAADARRHKRGLQRDYGDEALVAEARPGEAREQPCRAVAHSDADDAARDADRDALEQELRCDVRPLGPERLAQALDKVQGRMKPEEPQSHSAVERIPVVKSGRKVLVPIDQIRYIEAKDDYSCIYTDVDRFLSTISLAKLEQKLAPHGFFRVHRGYIVNLEYVEDVEVISSGILQLGINGIEGKKISVSRRRVVALKRALGL